MKITVLLLVAIASSAVAAGPGRDNDFDGRRVLLIGIDGCRPDALRAAMNRGFAPNIKKLADEGSFTTQVYTGGETGGATEQATVSGPGWATILTGVWRNKHRVKDNRFGGNRLPVFPHFMRRIKEVKPTAWCASFCNWHEIHNFIADGSRSNGMEFLNSKFTAPHDPAKKHQDWAQLDIVVRDAATAHLRDADPDAMFVYFAQVDEIGHAVADPKGSFSPENEPYLGGIKTVDGLVGDLLASVRARPRIADERWLILLTTDHGGRGTSHGGQTEEERTIWLLSSDPELGRALPPTPIGQTSIAHLVLRHLQLEPSADWGWEPAPFTSSR